MGLFKCNECSLGEKSNGVTGRYLYQSDEPTRKLMIISDCPHDSDSFVGTYFSNKHANNFVKLLTQDTHYDIKDVYVTGLVKCTPFLFKPDPTRDINKETIIKKTSITACAARLIEEIATVEPKYIIVCGEKPFAFFFPKLVFSDNRGKILHNEEYNVDILATYNPISMAYTNKFDRLIRTDFQKMHDHIYGADPNTTISATHKDYRFPLKDLSLLEALAKRLREVETFAVDIETHGTGLFNYKLLSIGFSYKEHTGVSVPVWVRDDAKVAGLRAVLDYEKPKRYIEIPNGEYKNGKPKVKKLVDKEFKPADRMAIKALLSPEYHYLADLPTLTEIKQRIRAILDREPPLKKYWGDQHDHCMALIRDIMENDTPKGFHNGGYDVNRLRGIGIVTKNYAWDTILMHHLLDEERPHNLDDLSYVYTQDGGYKSGKNVYLQSSNTSWANIPIDTLLPYNAQDADVTLQLYHIFKPELQKQGRLWDLFNKQVMPAQRVLLDMSFRGSNIDMEWLNKTQAEYRQRMKDLVVDFQICLNKVLPNCYVVANKAEEDAYRAERKAESDTTPEKQIINLNSNAHMVYVFRDLFGCKMEKKTATGDSLDANVLKKIAKKNKAAEILLEYKELAKLDGTYLTGIKEGIDADGKIHGEFLVYGTTSGRLSSRNPNLQNQPAEMKPMYVPPKGYICVNVDQSAAELHVMAWMAQDHVMMTAFEQKKDLHNFTACGIFNKKPEEITHEERQIGKKINFMSAYAVSGPGLAEQLRNEGVKITDNQANKYLEKWRNHYRGCSRFLENTVKTYKQRGYLETPFGRRRHKYKVFADKSKEDSTSRTAQNFTIQSTASDIQISEMVEMYPTLIEHDVWPVFTVHDSITMWVRPENLEWLRNYYKEKTCRRFSNDELPGINNCLMITEMEVGRNYGEHVKLPYDCDFQKWKEDNHFLFDNSDKQ